VSRLLFHDWFPQIVYNQHQSPPFPAASSFRPMPSRSIQHSAAVMEGINAIGMAMKERFARENKPGILSYHGYDGWWNGGLRSVPAFHNMHGILTETALNSYANHRAPTRRPTFPPDSPTASPPASRPCLSAPLDGRQVGIRDAIEYMLTADFAVLNIAATRRADYLLKSYQLARQSIETGKQGKPFAYVIPANQWDRPTAGRDARASGAGGNRRAARAGYVPGRRQILSAGVYVALASQPFRAYLVDLLEPQAYRIWEWGRTEGPSGRTTLPAGRWVCRWASR